MSSEGPQLLDHPFAPRSGTRPEVATKAVAPDAQPNILLLEVQRLIRGVLAQPAEGVDSEVVALVRGAMKMHRNFQVSLTLRALKLEQGLRKAQEQVIRLQWELAQARRCGGLPSPAPETEDYSVT
jgi:hypothetical protein